MRRQISVFLCATFLLATAACVSTGGSGPSKASPAKLNPNEWQQHGNDAGELRYSTLTQINADNVSQLGLAWFADFTERGQYQSTPVMVDGRIYATTPWSKVYAFDAKTGERLWKYDPQVPRELASTSLCCNNSNRGVVYYKGKIIWGTLDGRLIAVDAKKGTKVWEAQTTDPKDPMSITGAPRVGNGVVFIGQAGAEFHQRGYMSGWDAETGKKLWKFFLVPGDPKKGPDGEASDDMMAMAAETWKGEWWKAGGGATPWDGIVYDEVNDLVIFGTGNGAPWPAEVRSPGGGDNLFTASIVALHGKTGKYAWHYQTTPLDSFDFDNTSPLTVTDLTIEGQKRRVVMQTPKNGVFYVIDSASGKVISAQLVVPFANWLTGFDKANNWKPILNPDANFGKTGKGWYVVPFQTHVWNPQSFNPQTGLFYVTTRYATYGMVAEAGAKMGNQLLSINVAKRPETAAPVLEGAGTWLSAWDPVKQKAAWTSREGSSGGTMTTAGNLVFQGTTLTTPGSPPKQVLSAFRADNGQRIWSGESGATIAAGAITYQIDGVQYVAAVAGGAGATTANRLVVYKLGGTERLPPPAPAAPVQAFNPPPNFGDDAMRSHGQEIYQQNCTICHEGGRGMGGFPDLRATPMMGNEQLFKSIVYDGILTENGMLSFKKTLTTQDIEAVRAYLVSVANNNKNNPQPAGGRGPGGGGGGRAPAAPAGGTPLPQQPNVGLHQ